MKCLIDADSMLYILGWNAKDLDISLTENYVEVINKVDVFVSSILVGCQATEYIGFLGGNGTTFRHVYSNTYKGNRGTAKPEWFDKWGGVIKQRLTQYWRFQIVEGIEAEDAVSMLAYHHLQLLNHDVIVAHIDKDLNQIPGKHYNYKTGVSSQISFDEAYYNLFFQVLTGDSTDNIKGLPGCGKVGATKILTPCRTGDEVMIAAIKAYTNQLGQREGINQFTENYTLVKLLDSVPAELTAFKPQGFSFCKFDLVEAQEKAKLFANLMGSADIEPSKNYFES